MPSAAPVPRGPSVLALGSAAELLTRPGCPVCRHAAEASDRHLAWFALEAHADPVTITRLCASLGMCARHTRRLIGQPGAAARLTVIYRYLLQDAREQLAGQRRRLATCPACQYDEAAAGRALDTLLDGLSETGVWERYLELGGMCWPHVRAAASVRGHRRAVAWVVGTAATSTADQPVSIDLVAGGPDYDADERARLRAALPAEGCLPPGTCLACFMSAQAELAELTGLVQAAGRGRWPDDGVAAAPSQKGCLCAWHLRDAALMGDDRGAGFLGWQAGYQAASLSRLTQPPAWRRGGNPAGLLRGRRSAGADDGCPMCRARDRSARQALRRWAAQHAAAPAYGDATLPDRAGGQLLCVRHVLALRAADPAAGQRAAVDAAQRAVVLIEELAEAFRKSTWAFRHEIQGQEMTAWRRAAAFLDGGIFGGGPPE